jgi:hypothetical protein
MYLGLLTALFVLYNIITEGRLGSFKYWLNYRAARVRYPLAAPIAVMLLWIAFLTCEYKCATKWRAQPINQTKVL